MWAAVLHTACHALLAALVQPCSCSLSSAAGFIALPCCGFSVNRPMSAAKNLSKKFAALYYLLEDLLSPQKHYGERCLLPAAVHFHQLLLLIVPCHGLRHLI